MPIYEYRCESCGHVFEDMVLSGHKEPDTCPKCGAAKVDRLISNTSFQLKGSGWYVTEYGSGSAPPVSETPSAETESTETKTESSKGEDTSSSSSDSTDNDVA